MLESLKLNTERGHESTQNTPRYQGLGFHREHTQTPGTSASIENTPRHQIPQCPQRTHPDNKFLAQRKFYYLVG